MRAAQTQAAMELIVPPPVATTAMTEPELPSATMMEDHSSSRQYRVASARLRCWLNLARRHMSGRVSMHASVPWLLRRGSRGYEIALPIALLRQHIVQAAGRRLGGCAWLGARRCLWHWRRPRHRWSWWLRCLMSRLLCRPLVTDLAQNLGNLVELGNRQKHDANYRHEYRSVANNRKGG